MTDEGSKIGRAVFGEYLCTAVGELLDEQGDDISDFVPYFLAAHCEDHLVLALENVHEDGLAVVVGEEGFVGASRLPLLKVSLRLDAVNDLQVLYSPPLQLPVDAVVP